MDVNINSQKAVYQHNCLAKQLKRVLWDMISSVMGFDHANRMRHEFSPVYQDSDPTKRVVGSPCQKVFHYFASEHLAWKISIIACSVQCWIRPVMLFLPQQPAPSSNMKAHQWGKSFFVSSKLMFLLSPETRTYVFSALGSCHLFMIGKHKQQQWLVLFWVPLVPPDNNKVVICA